MRHSQGQQRMSDQFLVLLWAQVPALQHLKLLGLSSRLPCKQQQAPAISDPVRLFGSLHSAGAV